MSNAQRYRAGIDALNARDWVAYRSAFADDLTYVDYGAGLTLSGADAFVGMQQGQLVPFPDQQVRIVSLAEGGNVVVGELVVDATHTAPLALPTGDVVAATGHRIGLHVVSAAEYDG